jgi:PIN domain nuclease of toxin-antitoxin system
MRYLLDTHVFLWMISDRDRVSPAVRRELDNISNEVVYSAVVSWEIVTKQRNGKLHFSGSPLAAARKIGLTELTITSTHCEKTGELEPHHRDPFDRLLIAQAIVEGLVLVTHDRALAAYNVPILQV